MGCCCVHDVLALLGFEVDLSAHVSGLTYNHLQQLSAESPWYHKL